jgi:hypothetical protein
MIRPTRQQPDLKSQSRELQRAFTKVENGNHQAWPANHYHNFLLRIATTPSNI